MKQRIAYTTNVLSRISDHTRLHYPNSPLALACNKLFGSYWNLTHHVWDPPPNEIANRFAQLFFTAIAETQRANLPQFTDSLTLLRNFFRPPLDPHPAPWD